MTVPSSCTWVLSALQEFPCFVTSLYRCGLKAEFSILVAGGGPSTDAEQALIRETGLLGHVQFVVCPSDASLAQLYTHAQLLVYPSLYEGFGFPPLEAMSFECPVLAARSSCLPEICSDAAFYFEPEDLESFVSSLRTACFDESQRETKVREGKRLAASYSWQKCAAETLCNLQAISTNSWGLA